MQHVGQAGLIIQLHTVHDQLDGKRLYWCGGDILSIGMRLKTEPDVGSVLLQKHFNAFPLAPVSSN